MNEQQFIKDLEEILEMDSGTISLGQSLEQLSSWDSLAVISFLAMADAKYGVKIAPSELKDCKTTADLMKLVEKT